MLVVLLALVAGASACSRAIKSSQPDPPNPQQMAEFWIDRPVESRELLWGPGNPAVPPKPNSILQFVKDDTTGFSRKYVTKDQDGHEWNVKLGPEAQPEVVSSRLVWALGYHQLPQYVVGRWVMRGGGELDGTMPAGRFRRDEPGYKNADNWSWHENPFVGTQPYKGLLVLMIMLNNSDLKPEQNRIYAVTARNEMPRRLYVVSDLGLSWGESGISDPKRGDAEAFERQGFIKSISGNKIEFHQKNLRAELFDQLTPADVRWMAQRMSRLTDKQWQDAFHAGGYEDPALINRFVARMKQKIAQGLKGEADPTSNNEEELRIKN
jgi:hypothetical protein